MMSCSPSGHKTFLVSCNISLLFVGLSVFILGIKMNLLLSVLLSIDVPSIHQAVQAIIATGFFISLAGVTGIAGACCDTPWLIVLHLVALGVIVVMEFGLGVTLLVVRKTIENYILSMDCNTNCAATLDNLVLEYALPSAGLMLTIIIVEAMMIYSAIKLCSHIRTIPKILPLTSDVTQNVPMQTVVSPFPGYPANRPLLSPRMDYEYLYSAFPSVSSPVSPFHPEYPNPPMYSSLPPEDQQPPTFMHLLSESSAEVLESSKVGSGQSGDAV